MKESLMVERVSSPEPVIPLERSSPRHGDPRGYRHIKAFPKPSRPKTLKECSSPRHVHLKDPLKPSRKHHHRTRSHKVLRPCESLERLLAEDESLPWPSFAEYQEVDITLELDPKEIYRRPRHPETAEEFMVKPKPLRSSLELPALVVQTEPSPEGSPFRRRTKKARTMRVRYIEKEGVDIRKSLGSPEEIIENGRGFREAVRGEGVSEFEQAQRSQKFVRRQHRRVTSPEKLRAAVKLAGKEVLRLSPSDRS